MRVTSLAIAALALAGESLARGPHAKRPHSPRAVSKRNAHKQAKRQVVTAFPPKSNSSFEDGVRYTIMDNDWGA